ncbi:MAG: Dabb family protein [Planctomycetota bacterium]
MRRAWFVLAFGLLSGCAYLPDPPNYVHVVLYKFRSGSSAADVEALFSDCRDLLARVPSLKGVYPGRPVPRPSSAGYPAIADYDVGVVFLFDSQKGLQDFLDHPAHRAFEEKYAARIEARSVDFSPYSGAPRP